MISREGLPPTPEWHPERHKCPFPIDACQICSAVSEAAELVEVFTVEEVAAELGIPWPLVPANIILGAE